MVGRDPWRSNVMSIVAAIVVGMAACGSPDVIQSETGADDGIDETVEEVVTGTELVAGTEPDEAPAEEGEAPAERGEATTEPGQALPEPGEARIEPAAGARSAAPAAREAAGAKGSPRPTTREPTEAELYAVFEAEYAAINAELRRTEEACRNRDLSADPMLALQCLAILGSSSGGQGGMRVRLTSFRKIACQKAAAQPGYNCDYDIGLAAPGSAIPPSMAGLMQRGQGQGRFVRTSRGWGSGYGRGEPAGR